jgi:hypothetical protein
MYPLDSPMKKLKRKKQLKPSCKICDDRVDPASNKFFLKKENKSPGDVPMG